MSKIIKIDGGIGRVIAATGSLPNDCIVATSFPDIFIGNKKIKRVYNLGHAFLFEDVVFDNDWIEVEPYNSSDYYREKKHLSQVLNNMWNGIDEATKPIINLQSFELDSAKEYINQATGGDKYIIFQPFGSNQEQDITRRAMPQHIAQLLVDYIVKKGYKVLYIKGPDHKPLNKVIEVKQQTRAIFSIVANADKFICVDSFVQHVCASQDKNALVFWCGTDERNVGYESNTNHRVGESMKHANRIPMNNPDLLTNNPYHWDYKTIQSVVNKYLGMTQEVDKDETNKD